MPFSARNIPDPAGNWGPLQFIDLHLTPVAGQIGAISQQASIMGGARQYRSVATNIAPFEQSTLRGKRLAAHRHGLTLTQQDETGKQREIGLELALQHRLQAGSASSASSSTMPLETK